MNIIVRNRGGLGNQMFQYAYIYLHLKDQKEYKLIFDLREYDKYYWPFSLNKFDLSIKHEEHKSGRLKYDNAMRFFHIYQKCYSVTKRQYLMNFWRKGLKKGYLFCGVSAPQIDIQSFNKFDTLYLYGYFQNASILEKVRKDLCKEFSYNSQKTSDIISRLNDNAIAISIRLPTSVRALSRSDRMENTIQSKDYYNKVLTEYIDINQNTQLVVFSNNIEEVKNTFGFDKLSKNIIYINNLSPEEQIEVMKHCKDFIISNSTFSWWGSFLGSYLNKGRVFAPRIWYDNRKIEETDLFFKEMIIVEVQ